MSSGSNLDYLLEQNRRWAAGRQQQDGDFFARLSRAQQPNILWIGCADSRVPPTQIVGAQPGDLFVHRNIANVVSAADASCMAVLCYAVQVLRVRHIVVCGHTGCGGVQAAMADAPHGEIDGWLAHIKTVRDAHAEELAQAVPDCRADLLGELNVKAQLRHVAETGIVKNAWAGGQDLTLHGWIYNLADGLIKRLETIEGE